MDKVTADLLASLKEITGAMRRYEADAEGDSPYMHREMMHRVENAIAAGEALAAAGGIQAGDAPDRPPVIQEIAAGLSEFGTPYVRLDGEKSREIIGYVTALETLTTKNVPSDIPCSSS